MKVVPSLVLLLLPIVGSCSQVRVLKVPTPTQYNEWGDDEQRRADQMEGFRFYMQRPCLAVYDPFPVHSRSYIVDGMVSPDGQHVTVLRPDQCDPELSKVLKTCYCCSTALSIPYKHILDGRPIGARRGGQESAEGTIAPDGGQQADTGKTGDSPVVVPFPNVISEREAAAGTRGVTDLRVDVLNDPYPITPLRKHFDIVNLPDFDEQFVVSRFEGIGSAEIGLVVGQGGILQGFEGRIDNSSVSNLLFGLISTAANALSAKGLNALGLLDLPVGQTANALEGAAQDGGQESDVEMARRVYAGTPVSLRITTVSYATPGVYPIMKPRESMDWARACSRRDCHGRAIDSCPACRINDQTLVVRVGPYGIPYNTFQYVLVESLMQGVTPIAILDRETGAPTPSASELTSLKTDILSHLGDPTGAKFDVPDPTLNAGTLNFVIRHKVETAVMPSPGDKKELASFLNEGLVRKMSAKGAIRASLSLPPDSEHLMRMNRDVAAAAKEADAATDDADKAVATVVAEKMGEILYTVTKGPNSKLDEADFNAQLIAVAQVQFKNNTHTRHLKFVKKGN